MKKLLSLVVLALLVMSSAKNEKIRIACLGDSITYGAGIMNREENSYPVQLGKILGEGFDVKNFGMSGRTMLFGIDRSYNRTKLYTQLIDFKPNIVFIMLGTNDSKTLLRDKAGNFEKDYKQMIADLKKAIPNVRIILFTPPKVTNNELKYDIDKEYVEKTIVPSVRKIAFEQELEILDMHSVFENRGKHFMPDMVHPSALGAALMVKKIREYLVLETEDYSFAKKDEKADNYFGFNSYNFDFEGNTAKVATPKSTAKGKPWLLRTEKWTEQNINVDVALLEKGYHIFYINLSTEKQTKKFYKFITKKGFAKKLTLEPKCKDAEKAVKEVLIANERYDNPCTVPTPGAEYRLGYDWARAEKEIVDMVKGQKIDILFLGNSITQALGGKRPLVKYKSGEASANKQLSAYTWHNAGIAGDRTEHLLYRIKNDNYQTLEPKYVVINIGINNLETAKDSGYHTFEGIEACVKEVTKKMPNAKILLFSTLPSERNMEECLKIDELVKKNKWPKNVTYIDPYPLLAPNKTTVITELYRDDKLHINEKGYDIWLKEIKKHIK